MPGTFMISSIAHKWAIRGAIIDDALRNHRPDVRQLIQFFQGSRIDIDQLSRSRLDCY